MDLLRKITKVEDSEGLRTQDEFLRPINNEAFERDRVDIVDMWTNSKISMNDFPRGQREYVKKVFDVCAALLMKESEEVCKLVLSKLLEVLRFTDVGNGNIRRIDGIGATLVPALFGAIRKCTSPVCRDMLFRAFGRLGAIDPGRLVLSGTFHIDRSSVPVVFFFAGIQFYVDLLEKAAVVFAGISDAKARKECSYSIRKIFCLLLSIGNDLSETLWNSLSESCKKELAVFRNGVFTNDWQLEFPELNLPIIECENADDDYMAWISRWYITGASKVHDSLLHSFFEALHGLVKADFVFGGFMLAHIIIVVLEEGSETFVEEFESEMKRVFQGALHTVDRPPFLAYVIFTVIDYLERYIVLLSEKRIRSEKVRERCERLVSWILRERLIDGTLLTIEVAEKCHCVTRALKWLEQYIIGRDGQGCEVFDKNQYFILQRLYSELDDLDGVLGTVATIKNNVELTIDEQFSACEATGDYMECSGLYQFSIKNNLRCPTRFLRSKQPLEALALTEQLLKESCNNPASLDELRAVQIEALWRLNRWSELENLVDQNPQISSWEASIASVLCSLKHRDITSFDQRMALARKRLAVSITAVTMVGADAITSMNIEDADNYAQAYKYITRLHILSEIEDGAKDHLNLLNDEEAISCLRLDSVVKYWQERSDLVLQHKAVLEPIYRVRRDLLELCKNEKAKIFITDSLLQSCRMSRLSGDLQSATVFRTEAKRLDAMRFEVPVEESCCLFEKGNRKEAVDILSRLSKKHFANELAKMETIVANKDRTLKLQLAEAFGSKTVEEKAVFVKLQLLLADFTLKTGACTLSELCNKLVALPFIVDPSEDLYYRVAVFLDTFLKNGSLKLENVTRIVEAYTKVLVEGRTHQLHVLSRLLTLWLDSTEKASNGKYCCAGNAEEQDGIKQLNKVIWSAFSRLGKDVFYAGFSQLISRIAHPDLQVFGTLEKILAELIVTYPHQCLWQSIAIFRSHGKRNFVRYQRCKMIYGRAKRICTSGSLGRLISSYEYVAASFIRIAEDDIPPGTYQSFSSRYGFLGKFFQTGETDKSVRVSDECRVTDLPRVSFPTNREFTNIYIERIDEEFVVMKSALKPKKVTVLASDGKKYTLLCKAKDELRKDSRFLEISRMVDALLHRNPEARRKGLSVRTYNVVPLQDAGGLIETIPNLKTFTAVLEPLMAEKCDNLMDEKERFSRWKVDATLEERLRLLREEYYPRHPVVMADFFSRSFLNPHKWYAGRLAFVRTSAIMSMIGFIMGLGDRHGKNLLIDIRRGDVVHVDFNSLFNKGDFMTVPEVVPFRLTRNMLNGFGVTGVEGAFRMACETTMNVLRENEEVICSVLETLVHDPILEWSLEGHLLGKEIAAYAVRMIRFRLKGKIVSPIIYANYCDEAPMTVEDQVEKVIQLAVDERNLARMYIGWSPFL